ncbi:MAG: metal-dependent transcriptional regulator [Planctomycetota bacterium]|jgi:DtxR family Mn-dependent transcriptional regulator
MVARRFEEVLEAIWICSEANDHSVTSVIDRAHAPVDDVLLSNLETRGWIARTDGILLMTKAGKDLTAPIIRRRRLAERLMVDALKMTADDVEKPACEFEHLLVPEVTESICTLLGHPRICPHGLPIPPGKCCEEAREVVDQVAVPASKLGIGECARVDCIIPKTHSRLHKLMSFGINPGVEIQVHQKSPAYVIRCEHAEIGLEKDVADDIFVWRSETSNPR